jgi:hypothetical protein
MSANDTKTHHSIYQFTVLHILKMTTFTDTCYLKTAKNNLTFIMWNSESNHFKFFAHVKKKSIQEYKGSDGFKTFIYDGDSCQLMQINKKMQMANITKSWRKPA